MKTPHGDLDLLRHEQRRTKSPLRAWDAGDELLIDHVLNLPASPGLGNTIVVNDRFGALACALSGASRDNASAAALVSWSDSWSTHQITTSNLVRNELDPTSVHRLPSTEDPPAAVETVLLKVPKSLTFLEDQLVRLASCLPEGATLVGGAMARHIHRSTLDLFERLIGPTTTSRATKKARLIFAVRDSASAPPIAGDWPRTFAATPDLMVSNHPGVFSLDRLDIGTRLLLDNLSAVDATPPVETIVDLGCGSGIIGTALAAAFKTATVAFVDDSYLAVASAEATFLGNEHDPGRGRFQPGDCLLDPLGRVDDIEAIDLIVSNPPFHEDHSIGDAVAWQMFSEAKRALRPGGRLIIVGNRHLGYHAKLKRIFGNCETIASNRKFVLLSAAA